MVLCWDVWFFVSTATCVLCGCGCFWEEVKSQMKNWAGFSFCSDLNLTRVTSDVAWDSHARAQFLRKLHTTTQKKSKVTRDDDETTTTETPSHRRLDIHNFFFSIYHNKAFSVSGCVLWPIPNRWRGEDGIGNGWGKGDDGGRTISTTKEERNHIASSIDRRCIHLFVTLVTAPWMNDIARLRTYIQHGWMDGWMDGPVGLVVVCCHFCVVRSSDEAATTTTTWLWAFFASPT